MYKKAKNMHRLAIETFQNMKRKKEKENMNKIVTNHRVNFHLK